MARARLLARKKKTPSGVKWQDGRFLPRKEYRKLWNWEREEHAKIVANLPKDKKGRGNRTAQQSLNHPTGGNRAHRWPVYRRKSGRCDACAHHTAHNRMRG